MLFRSALTMEMDVDRFGNNFFAIVDASGWTVATYLESEKDLAKSHAETGVRPRKTVMPSAEVAALFLDIRPRPKSS